MREVPSSILGMPQDLCIFFGPYVDLYFIRSQSHFQLNMSILVTYILSYILSLTMNGVICNFVHIGCIHSLQICCLTLKFPINIGYQSHLQLCPYWLHTFFADMLSHTEMSKYLKSNSKGLFVDTNHGAMVATIAT